MITYLHLEHFVKHENSEFYFSKGLTAISGKNGGGKSLIQEAIRFALFGTPALRGKLDNYDKRLKVTAHVVIGGGKYEIVRTLKDCKFGSIVGTTACNKAIEEKLGFGMNVFDMGCCAKQFEITRLGDMKPAERKLAVDKLIGLDTLELLRKDVKQTISELKGRKEGMEKYLTEPVAPEQPDGYLPTSDIRTELASMRSDKQLLGEKVAVWSTLPTSAPEKLECGHLPQPKGSLALASRKEYLEKKLDELPYPMEDVTPAIDYEEELARVLAWKNFMDLEEPRFSKEECKCVRQEWEIYNNWLSAKKVTCPKCGETFTLSGVKEAEEPTVSYEYLLEQETAIFKWEHKPDCPRPELNMSEHELRQTIANRKALEAQRTEWHTLNEELENIGECGSVDDWEKYQGSKNAYDRAKQEYLRQKEGYEKAQVLLKEISVLNERLGAHVFSLEQLESLEMECYQYECKRQVYERELERYEEVRSELDEMEKELTSYQKADEGLVSLKSKIKLYVIPSLQKVATNLVSEMTDGELNSVTINEDFEICVNEKELNLLSGSEKAVANLAIRLGLGCVLTHKIFNVFLGDEIDESMSEERAEMVAKSLHKLLNQIDQIILISHKDIEADNYIKITA